MPYDASPARRRPQTVGQALRGQAAAAASIGKKQYATHSARDGVGGGAAGPGSAGGRDCAGKGLPPEERGGGRGRLRIAAEHLEGLTRTMTGERSPRHQITQVAHRRDKMEAGPRLMVTGDHPMSPARPPRRSKGWGKERGACQLDILRYQGQLGGVTSEEKEAAAGGPEVGGDRKPTTLSEYGARIHRAPGQSIGLIIDEQLTVADVTAGSCAAIAGIRPGLRLTSIDGQRVKSQLQAVTAIEQAGMEVVVKCDEPRPRGPSSHRGHNPLMAPRCKANVLASPARSGRGVAMGCVAWRGDDHPLGDGGLRAPPPAPVARGLGAPGLGPDYDTSQAGEVGKLKRHAVSSKPNHHLPLPEMLEPATGQFSPTFRSHTLVDYASPQRRRPEEVKGNPMNKTSWEIAEIKGSWNDAKASGRGMTTGPRGSHADSGDILCQGADPDRPSVRRLGSRRAATPGADTRPGFGGCTLTTGAVGGGGPDGMFPAGTKGQDGAQFALRRHASPGHPRVMASIRGEGGSLTGGYDDPKHLQRQWSAALGALHHSPAREGTGTGVRRCVTPPPLRRWSNAHRDAGDLLSWRTPPPPGEQVFPDPGTPRNRRRMHAHRWDLPRATPRSFTPTARRPVCRSGGGWSDIFNRASEADASPCVSPRSGRRIGVVAARLTSSSTGVRGCLVATE